MYIAFAKYLFEGTILIEVIRILVVMQCGVTLKMMLTAEGCRYDYFFWVCFCIDIWAFWFGYCCHYSLLWIFSPFAISFMMIMVTLIKRWHITKFVLFLCKSYCYRYWLKVSEISVFFWCTRYYRAFHLTTILLSLGLIWRAPLITSLNDFKLEHFSVFLWLALYVNFISIYWKKAHLSCAANVSRLPFRHFFIASCYHTWGGGYRLLRACAHLRSTFLLGLHSRLNLSASRNKWPLRME